MNDGAIDFRQMLKEEKKKARQKKQAKQPENDTPKTSADQQLQSEKSNPATSLDLTAVDIREEDMEAIDFGALKEKLQKEQKMAESWSIPSVFDRQEHLVCSNPPNIYYLPNFLPREVDQQALLEWLQQLPENPHSSTQDSSKANGNWTNMKYAKRRVALFDNQVAAVPAPLALLSKSLVEQGIFPSEQPPNHILVNEYHAGQGILPHTDGPAYWSRTATLSLGSDVLIQFTPRPNHETTVDKRQLRLEKACLLVFEDSAYLDYCHGIDDRVLEEQVAEGCLNANVGDTATREYRISLTFRHKKH